MERILVVLMILAGFGVAVIVMMALAAAEKRDNASPGSIAAAAATDEIEITLLVGVAMTGGLDFAEAVDRAREGGFRGEPRVYGDRIDTATWAEALRQRAGIPERERVLDAAVRLAVSTNSTIPLVQYTALLDLSFGLGFQTDALARLRARYRFDHIDNARRGRPMDADRRARQMPFARRQVDRDGRARLLGLGDRFSRRELVSAYRRLAAQEHPDRYHGLSRDEQQRASARFIELTEAYEELLPWAEDD